MYSQIAANKRKTVLLMFGFFVLIGLIAWAFSYFFADSSILIYVLIFSIGYAFWSYFASAKLALSINGAKEIQKSDNPRLWRTVENLAITDGLPMPKVYIIDDPGMNAFATGRDPNHASVAITSGLLDKLDDPELQGVMAHELGHVKNYDIRVSMIAFALVGIIALLCDFFLRMSFWGSMSGDGGGDSDNNNSGWMAVIAIVALILAPIAASLIQLAISRKREYLADATGVMTTRYPEGLISALKKIELNGSKLKRQNTSTAHLFFASPLKKKSFSALFSTHPPIEDRIVALQNAGENL